MFDVVGILHWLGPFVLVGVFLIIFAECALLIGLVLPGDPTLFTAGLLAATGAISADLATVAIVVATAAVLGNIGGYWIGVKVGPALFERPSARFLHKGQLQKVEKFFEKYGPLAIVLARFLPLARTLITAVAGMARMDPKRYFVYSTIGGIAWAAGMTLLGGLLGQIPWVAANVDTMLLGMTLAIITISVVPIIRESVKRRRKKNANAPETIEA
ncbi:DedA family protein [Streptomyces sp. DvalAA-19]|uniref:DedA family protein n=1 Tax=Streptomyces sp. DvalAA-19 TaxID=1839761 RepID=UPI00081BA808|nr:DedA family protein [Streptomyces sp. DvalAA-19]SCE09144.1 membrane-associated protein [Streptomyces sp. DvalAA-19]